MAIRLAVAASSAEAVETHLAAIKEAGFAAVDAAVGDVARLKPALDAAGLKIACVNTDVSLHVRETRKWDMARAELTRGLDVAGDAGALCIRVFGGALGKGEGLTACTARLADRVSQVMEVLGKTGIKIAIQNAGSFVLARDLWLLLETIGLAGAGRVGACLDVGAAALAGESPVLSVPTLNARIFHVRLCDVKDGKIVALGTGIAKVKLAVERLRGIGYGGTISYVPPTGGDLAGLKELGHELQLWAGLIEPPKPPEPAKPAPKAATVPAKEGSSPANPATVPVIPPESRSSPANTAAPTPPAG